MTHYITVEDTHYAVDTMAQRCEVRRAMAAAEIKSARVLISSLSIEELEAGDLQGSDVDAGYSLDRTAKLVLGRDGMGSSDSEEEFDSWCSYVCERIDEASGLDVTVEIATKRDVQEDRYSATSDEERQVLRDAVQRLWEQWCAESPAGDADEVVLARATPVMDDDIRESLHTEALTPGEFLERYASAHFQKYGEKFSF